jgi:hypothetical protein
MIQIVRNGAGPWPEYAEDGTVVSVTCRGSTLVIDCAERQTDARVTIDIVHGADGALIEGASFSGQGGESYVATLEIPPARYTAPEPQAPDPEEEDMFEGAAPERLPLTAEDMIAVTLRLWTIPDIRNAAPDGRGA